MVLDKTKNLIERTYSGTVIGKPAFADAQMLSLDALWINLESISKVAALLKNDEGLCFDWLENLSVVQIEQHFIFTYFLRSSTRNYTLNLRGFVELKGNVKVTSVINVWPMAELVEGEISDLFGVGFDHKARRSILPEDWEGHPLRKTYKFPIEVFGIRHELGGRNG